MPCLENSKRALRLLHALVAAMKSFYEVFYWCRQCHRWKEKTEALQDAKGNPCCPTCGRRLRTRPLCSWRNKKAKTSHKTSTLGDNATSIQTLHEGGGFHPRPAKPTVAESNIKHAKPPNAEKPCSHNMESHQKAGVLKK